MDVVTAFVEGLDYRRRWQIETASRVLLVR